ncbi:MAG: bile acid:sodium symporter family protein, partial [Alcanivoracaceae bacterium]|nr:bile acid:sodium symporter family protein [Alcanivoracaceae bacterium]
MQADLLTKVILPISLFFIMFGIGISLRPVDFKNIIKFPKAVTIGIFAQMVLLPMLAFIIAVIFDLPPEIAVGLIIIALAPGGVTSNMYSYLFKGDVSLSVSLTVLVSFITPLTMPLIAVLSMK